jgi:hypothetical protein
MSDEINMDNVPVELSDEELDGISAGGIDIFMSGSMFNRQDIFTRTRSSSRRKGFGSSSFSRSSNISSSAFQLIGLGFNSANDALGFVKEFGRLFGRR